MGAFPALPLGRRPIRCRILVVYRLDPLRLKALLPTGMEARVVRGHALAVACYTRLGSKRLFRRGGVGSARPPTGGAAREGGTEHLAYRIAIRQEDGTEGTWIARRETSSWLEARCGAKLLGGAYGRSAFQIREEAFRVELRVEGERGEAFYLRGEAAGAATGSLFPGAQALEAFLGAGRPVRPYDVFAPEADELDLADHFAPEPLAVFEARSAFLDEGPLQNASPCLDSAWRVVSRRFEVAPARRASFRILPERGTPSPALPT